MTNFDNFQVSFFQIFTRDNFFNGKTYLEYVADPQTNDEDNIVDTKIVLPLLTALGFQSGDIAKNTTDKGKDNSRPDFQVKISEGNICCFLVEDKHTNYDLHKPDPLRQLMGYAPSRGYNLGLVCNGRLLLGWDLSNLNHPSPVLHLDIQQIVETYQGKKIFSQDKIGFDALTSSQLQDLKGFYRRFCRGNFEDIERLIVEISKPETEWLECARSQEKTANFDELLIADLKGAIELLESDVLYQLDLLLEEAQQYHKNQYIPDGKEESAERLLERLHEQILNYLKAYGVLELEECTRISDRLKDFTERPRDSIEELSKSILESLQRGEKKKAESENRKSKQDHEAVQLDLIDLVPPTKQQELQIKLPPRNKIITLERERELLELLQAYERIVFDWKAWEARQRLNSETALKTEQYFISWRNLVTKTVLQSANERRLKEEFARQTAYVYVIRLFVVRICEDKGLIYRKLSDGGFKQWREIVEQQYLDLARGVSMDYLLEMSYRSAQSIYAHFFNSTDLFNWYRINSNTLIKVLHILNRFNLQRIDSDIIGMVYGRYVEEGKHEQGRYFTPKKVVDYILDCIGYTSDNPDIRDKKLLDPAGGSGSFLVHAARRLIDSYRSKQTGEVPIENIPSVIKRVKDSLFCLDINPFACYLAETNLLIQVIDLLKQAKDKNKLVECSIDRFNVYNTDSLLLPKSQEIRTSLLNPVLDLELSTVSQIKTKTGSFSEGFDFIVGNPPYVRADEPGVDAYRDEIKAVGRFETLHEKWDLFVPFVELACKLSRSGGKIGLIVSRGIQANPYADLLRSYLAKEFTILQVDFFNNVKLFSDAVVSNTIFFLENRVPIDQHQVKRILHLEVFETTETLESLAQVKYAGKVFKRFVLTETFQNIIDLEDICYCSVGMILNADEKKAKGAFKKEELLSSQQDRQHCKKYVDGENLAREFFVDSIRYLEWGTARVPSQIRRITIPELYDFPKILFGMTSFPTYDRGDGDCFYVPDSVRICVRWDDVYQIKRLKDKKQQMYELSKKRQRLLGDGKGKKIQIYEYAKERLKIACQFDLRYVAAILASSFGKRFLLCNSRDENIMSIKEGEENAKSRIYPDDLKEFPIKDISLEEQKPFIEKVDFLLAENWKIYELAQQGHKIKFKYLEEDVTIEIDFISVFERLNLPCWKFLDAESQRFEVVGDRDQPITKIKTKNNTIVNGKNILVQSDRPFVIEFLIRYLPQYGNRGLTWTNLLDLGQIPKQDEDIQKIFTECARLENEARQRIDALRQTYRELDRMVSQLYQPEEQSPIVQEEIS